MDNNIQFMREAVEAAGLFVGERDPKRNKAYKGKFMVCENHGMGIESLNAGTGGFCIVGDDLEALITEAFQWIEDEKALDGED